MSDNIRESEFVSFFRVVEHSQHIREGRIVEYARPHLESGTIPTPNDVRDAINSLVGHRRRNLLRYHRFWPEQTVRRGLDSLIQSAHQASIDASRHDAALGALADAADFEDIVDFAVGDVAQKDVVAYCALALGVRDTLKEVQSLRSDIAEEVSIVENRVYDTDISEFIRKLRNNLLHGRVLVPEWNVSFDGERRATTGLMSYSVEDLVASGKWNEQSLRYMHSSTDEHLHLSAVVRDHFALVTELQSTMDALFARNISESEWDYYQIEDSHKQVLRRQQTKILIGQVSHGKNPYDQLHQFFDPRAVREILRYPRHSKEQVDFMIALKSVDIDCDDELRQTLYRVFGVVLDSDR